MSEERDYKVDCKVDRFKLEVNAEQQAELYRYWSDKEGKARTEIDRIKNLLTLTEAEVEMDIREKLLKNSGNLDNGVKGTADAVKAAIVLDKRIKKVKHELIVAKDDHSTYNAAKNGMEHRKSAIDNLTKQWISGYWADPSRPKSVTDDMGNKLRHQKNKQGE